MLTKKPSACSVMLPNSMASALIRFPTAAVSVESVKPESCSSISDNTWSRFLRSTTMKIRDLPSMPVMASRMAAPIPRRFALSEDSSNAPMTTAVRSVPLVSAEYCRDRDSAAADRFLSRFALCGKMKPEAESVTAMMIMILFMMRNLLRTPGGQDQGSSARIARLSHPCKKKNRRRGTRCPRGHRSLSAGLFSCPLAGSGGRRTRPRCPAARIE